MSVNPENVDSWFESLADEALDRNNKSVCTWTKYKDDLEETKKILSVLPKKLKHSVMVPIGPKALMRGKIVHTNEYLVNLGETWFVKKSASEAIDLCDRRVKTCDEMLDRLRKEKELLESKKSLPAEKEAFGSEDRPEIIEYVSEQEHEEWTKQHRIKEKEYRLKLAEIRNKEKKPIETEEDLWNRLDELELREELEDELNRLNEEDDGSDYSDEDADDTETIEESSCSDQSVHDNDDDPKQSPQSISTDKAVVKNETKRVSFAVEEAENSSDDEPLRLEIRHSSNEPVRTPFSGVINSPSDIYESFLKTLMPQSILKKSVNVNRDVEMNNIKNETEDEVQFHISSGIVLNDVTEKNLTGSGDGTVISSYTEPTRKISKFKASRMKKS